MQPVLPNSVRLQLWLLSVLLLGSCGCANFMDTITSREFKVQDLWTKPPDSATVLRTSNDGEMRGRALGMLKEPLRNGGTQEQQELYIKVLVTAAVTNPVPKSGGDPLHPAYEPGTDPDCLEPLVRLGAIRALGEYQDVRAHLALKSVYQGRLEPSLAALGVRQGGPLPFHDEIKKMIKGQALRALDRTGSQTAREVFLVVATIPGGDSTDASKDQNVSNDERLAALRGLARFHDPEVLNMLVSVLATEKNIAVRQVACESLKNITGKNLPDDADRWRAFIEHSSPDAFAHQPSPWQRAMNFIGN